ncbi:peptide-methionine (S)-S-oxide reductase MsrA [Prochlorococcus sp. MIT 1307]|uniref:peptide-methionine (S)-S-oxide reductase MsrA n=1 Tax=Prochlorococcus sp. MIT 1307 TaxID=3096219 RepID=UPI002A7532C0|nr:peptide-methionine (S)-S-oxide reductase MsrA [Prochlorococcus sp. MIT 1307]
MKRISKILRGLLLAAALCLFCFSLPGLVEASQQEGVFAGGCFWCLEHDLENLPGVLKVESGYTGGNLSKPTYPNHKGHQEAVIVSFDSGKISYEKLLRNYWRNVDPLDGGGQFCDRGDSYRPVIFTSGDSQRSDAIESMRAAAKELNQPANALQVDIQDAQKFWLAEEYHQDFAKKNSLKYNFYRYSCARDKRLDEVWGDEARSGKAWR